MEKNEVYGILEKLEKYSIVSLKWNRGNGELESLVRFDGFDEDKNPKLILVGETQLDIRMIGGYPAIISVQEECPDGMC